MLANSFTFLPVKNAKGWHLISDLDIAVFLGTDVSERKKRLAQTLDQSGVALRKAKCCSASTSLVEVLRMLDRDQVPLLVCRDEDSHQSLVGIIAPFDLL
jgi:hypothetical protein